MLLRRPLPFAAAAALVCGALGVCGVASAQSIEDARGRWFDADFEASRDEFAAVLAAPTLTPAQAVDAHRFLAAIHLALGDQAEARAHAEAAVALEPTASPPEGAARGTEDLFRMARRRLGDRRAELTIEPRGAVLPDRTATLVARLDPSPAELASSLVLRCETSERSGPLPTVELVVVPRGDLVCVAEARSAAGAVLVSVTREIEVVRASETGAPVADERRRKRWPWIVGGSVAAAVLVSVVVGVVVHDRNQEASFGGTTVVGW